MTLHAHNTGGNRIAIMRTDQAASSLPQYLACDGRWTETPTYHVYKLAKRLARLHLRTNLNRCAIRYTCGE